MRAGPQAFYVYVLLEFQARVDRWMALRMQVYIGLLMQDLVKRDQLAPEGLLPVVFPVVFYHGEPAWEAATELADVLATPPDELAPYQPSQSYFLIDQRRFDQEALAKNPTVLAQLFRLELSEGSEVSVNVLRTLASWMLQAEQTPLRQSVDLWIRHLLRHRFGGNFGEYLAHWNEVETMAEKKYGMWTDAVKQRGIEEGRAKGREELAREVIKKVLRRQNGDLSKDMAARVDAAPAEVLERCIAVVDDTAALTDALRDV